MNRERYSDPTADIAIAHVMAEQKRNKGIGYTHSEHSKAKPKKIPPIISRKDGDEIPPHNTRDSLQESVPDKTGGSFLMQQKGMR